MACDNAASRQVERAATAERALVNTTRDESHTEAEPFHFFDLPRELRNNIYAYLARDVPAQEGATQSYVKASGFISTDICLLSKQVKQEYEEEILRSARIDLVHVGLMETLDLFGLPRSHPSSALAQHLSVQVNLQGFGLNMQELHEIMRFAQDIPGLELRFPTLRTLTLELHDELFYYYIEDYKDFFANPFHRSGDPDGQHFGTINVDKALVLRGHLYTANRKVLGDHELASSLEFCVENNIVYRVTPAPDPTYSWHGLQFEVVSAGHYSYEEGYARYLERMREEQKERVGNGSAQEDP